MSDSENDSTARSALIEKFLKLTNADLNEAIRLLEAHQWKFNAALAAYFDLETERNNLTAGNVKSVNNESTSAKAINKDTSEKHRNRKYQRSSSNIVTLSSLNAERRGHSSGSDSNEETGQAFYAGGTVSGQQVLTTDKNVKGLAEKIYNLAVDHGAEVIRCPSDNSNSNQVLVFKGTGHVLGSSSNDSATVTRPGQQEQFLHVTLRFWQNGFTIDDGPLRSYNNPENQALLDNIRQGKIPQELRNLIFTQRQGSFDIGIHLSLEDHSHEDYTPIKRSLQPFSGRGYRLGSPAPSTEGTQESVGDSNHVSEAERLLNIDETQPVTEVHVRLTDGTRLIVRVNYTHTVEDIRNYIISSRPEYSNSTFILMNSARFPMQEITDYNLTIQEANLVNSVLIQRIKKV